MPTPRDDALQLSSPGAQHHRSGHTTCPPDSRITEGWGSHDRPNGRHDDGTNLTVVQQPAHLFGERDTDIFDQTSPNVNQESLIQMDDIEQEQPSTDGQSPMSTATETRDGDPSISPYPAQTATVRPTPIASSIYEFSNIRQRPNHTSSFLRAGSKFRGTQQSDKQIYKVEVDIKHVDMNESFLCGYLRIEGLTEDHPTLVTYFEGEIIGAKYTFQTKHESWGATDKTDMQHWNRFPAWRPLAKQAKKPDFHYKNCAQRENMFMRWKEYFLVPNHTVREIPGASFEGFYYICFNQVAGTVSGIYFHARSEKYQQLELTHVDDRGCFAAIEFR